MSKNDLFHKIGQVVLHALFWCGVLFFYTYFFGFDSVDFNYILSFSLFLMPITIATTYVSIYKLIPDYLVKKHYFRFALYSFYTIVISAYLIVISILFGLTYLSNFRFESMAPVSKSMLFVAIAVYVVVIVVSAYKLFKLHLKQTRDKSKLESKILEAQLKLKEQELNYLKMQIHPHFLFNTLNTMYGFALKKADETPEMILMLSNLLDYLLYQVDKPFVLLQAEINHIQDYIELEKMRFNDTLNIEFTTHGITDDIKIAPMLLIPFVENSFKHGTIKSGQLEIKIRLECHDQNIHFYIENTNTNNDTASKGIGLENIIKRLDLLYSDNYNLTIDNTTDIFKVNLQLSVL